MHSIESRSAVGPSNILFAGEFACTFQTGNFTGWGSEWVNGSVITNLTMYTIELLSRKRPSIQLVNYLVIRGYERSHQKKWFVCATKHNGWRNSKTARANRYIYFTVKLLTSLDILQEHINPVTNVQEERWSKRHYPLCLLLPVTSFPIDCPDLTLI